jgi:histidinol-phosphatase (PHP family)
VLTDYHLHLRPDDDPEWPAGRAFTAANAERYREVAAERGVEELGVAEHIYRFEQALAVWQHPFWRERATDDLDAYADFVRNETDLKLGIEADFVPGAEDKMANLLDGYEWDYVVGSIHFLRDQALDVRGEFDIWRSNDPDRVWRRYFETLGEAARTGMFDILAHPDLVKVWGDEAPQPDGDRRRYYELAMDGIAEAQPAIEVSTAGLRKPVGEIYPARPFLEMCVEAGCPVALSSDAHTIDQVAFRYDDALEYLDKAGVTELATFDRRERTMEQIGATG